MTDDTGQTTSTYRYNAYGTLDEEGTTGDDALTGDPVADADVVNPYRFNAHRVNGATGTYDMGFRNYDPGLNRFLTRDMYNGALSDLALGADPWNTNRYAFTGGNPTTHIELDGHRAEGGGGSGTWDGRQILDEYLDDPDVNEADRDAAVDAYYNSEQFPTEVYETIVPDWGEPREQSFIDILAQTALEIIPPSA